MAKKRKTKAEQIASIPIEEISKLSGTGGMDTLRNYVKTLQRGYKRRVQQFKRKNLVSYAQIALETSMPEPVKRRKVQDMTRNQLIMEFARYSKFFKSETSTVEGIKNVNKAQDVRFFGSDKRGRAKKNMNNDQRIKFWTLYDEFIHQNVDALNRFGSERIQLALAEMIMTDTVSEDLDATFARLWTKLFKSEERNVDYGPNIYSGKGPSY